MKKLFLLIIILSGMQLAAQPVATDKINFTNNHPSLLIKAEDVDLMKKSIQETPSLSLIHQIILSESEKMLALPVSKYEKIGFRLLEVSRECLRRIFYLSYLYQTTGDEKYAKRAEQEMLAVSSFDNWNPRHFLDVAEMTMAVSIGYDWTYSYLSADSRLKISNAIVEKGINPSLEQSNNNWLKQDNNWNQVCNAGITFGALVVRDLHPELAQKIISRSLASISIPMAVYEPDGVFPEGYGYWGYGTTFNVLYISAIEKLFGQNSFPLVDKPGFMKTGMYMLHMMGSNGLCFNYSDSGSGAKGEFNPATFWFAKRTNDASLLWNEKKYVTADNTKLKQNRFLPTAILWGIGLNFNKVPSPKSNVWIGRGVNPVCMMRTSWTDKNSIYIGFKAGTPSESHGHMDAGSFVMDANGVRWASDFGMQSYNTLESKGVDLWNKKQNSQRWQVFRYNNFAHNTLAFNDSLQRVEGTAKIDTFSTNPNNMFVGSDLTRIYDGQIKKAFRTVSIIDKLSVKVIDEIETLGKPTKVRWTLLTDAHAQLIPLDNAIELTKNDKRLLIKVNSPTNVKLKIWSTQSKNDFDEANPGKRLVGFEIQLPENQTSHLNVSLIPQE